jgi:hypothetical protein
VVLHRPGLLTDLPQEAQGRRIPKAGCNDWNFQTAFLIALAAAPLSAMPRREEVA